MAFDVSNPGMQNPSQDQGAPPADLPQAADSLPAVEPGQPNKPSTPKPAPAPPPPKEPIVLWEDVIAKPTYQGLNPEQKEQVRNAYWTEIIAPKIPVDQQKIARQAFDKDTLPKHGPQASGGSVGKVLDYVLGRMIGPAEAGVHVGSQVAALPVEAAASVYELATAPPGLKAKEASAASDAVGKAMTYEPRTTVGRTITGIADAIAGVVPKVADWASSDIAEDPTLKRVLGPTGSAVAQGVANTAVQAIPTILGFRGGKAAVADATPAAAAARASAAATRTAEALRRAQDYIKNKTSLAWDKLSDRMRSKLAQAAEDPTALDKLKPEAIERQANLEKLKVPATRGQIERDVPQLTREEGMVKKGGPINEIQSAQDEAMHRQLDVVRRSTGAKAVTREQVGKTVQNDALRNKAAVSVKNYDRLYKEARATEPNATVKADPFYEFLEKNGEVLNPEVQHLGWLRSWLNKAKLESKSEGTEGISLETDVGKALTERGKPKAPTEEITRRPIKLAELDDLRKKASKLASKGGDNAYYAGEVLKAIDKSFDDVPVAAKKWKDARDAFRAHKIEFEDQSLVKQLTSNKGRSRTDRQTALEKTTDKILKSSSEDIVKLHKTLTEGGTDATRAAGKRAWANIQGGVIEALREKAAGRRSIPGTKGQKPFSSPYRDLFAELDANGKIDVLFSKKQAQRLRQLHEAVGDVRTKPSEGKVSGSDTAARQALTQAEKVGAIPYVGKTIAGVAKLGGKIMDLGEDARQNRMMKTSKLDDAANAAAKKQKSSGRSGNTLRSIKAAAGVAHRATLKDKKKEKKKGQ